MAFVIKQNDTRPKLVFQLVDGAAPTQTPVDLTTATAVKVIIAIPPGLPKVNAECDVVDAAEGICEYEWDAADTDEVGLFKGEAEVTWADGGVETFPNQGYFDITVTDDLG